MRKTPDEWALIAAAYQENRCSIRALAREFNISEAAIRKKVKQWNLVRSSQGQFALATGATQALVCGLLDAGVLDEAIADAFAAQATELHAARIGQV